MTKLILTIVLSLTLCSCYFNNEQDLYPVTCDTTNVTYSGVVKNIIGSNCAYSGCHAGSMPAASIDLSTYSGVKSIADPGQLVGVINHASGFPAMPKGMAKLSDCYISQITKWVNDGALNN